MLKRWRIALILVFVTLIGTLLAACGGDTSSPTTTGTQSTGNNGGQAGTFSCVQGSITASGSTALQPFVDAVGKRYQAKCQGASITVQPGGSKAGLAAVANGSVQIGNSDVFADKTQTDLVDHQVAAVIFAMIINPKVTGVTDIKSTDLKGIYTGQIKNWKEVGGNDLPITVVSRPATSGTRATFKQYMLDGTPESPAQAKALTVDSTGTVVQTVEQTDGSIGYVTLGAAVEAGTKVVTLKIDGQEPSADTIKDNAYKFWNIEHMYTKGQATGLAQALLNYMTSDDAKAVAGDLKFVTIDSISKNVLDERQPKV